MKYYLVPEPASSKQTAGRYLFSGEHIKLVTAFNLASGLPEFIDYHRDSDIPAEGYRLSIKTSIIEIFSSDEPGKFYAVKTLQQLLRQLDSNGCLECLTINDKPKFRTRAVMLDISRNKVPKMATLYRLIDLWAELKLNQVQFYTEHTFAYKNHKTVWKEASPLRSEEIRNLDEYCRNRSIELVPNQNSFGHMERWLIHDEYKSMAESPAGFVDHWGNHIDIPSTLSPVSEEVLPFISQLYDELLPCFSSNTINVGGDETYDLGQGKSRERCDRLGVGRVYLEFLKKLAEDINRRGMKMQFYGDIVLNHPELIDEIPKNLIALNWGYEADHPFEEETRKFAEAGVEYYICTGTSAWNSIAGRWNNALGNISSAAAQGIKNGASGFMITEWGDNGHWQQYPVSAPGYMAGASAAWSGAAGIEIDFKKNLSIHYFNDPTEKAAKGLLLMANMYEKYSKGVHNSSIFALTMMEPSYHGYRSYFPALRGTDFSEALDVLPGIKKLIDEADFGSDEGNVIRDELVFTLKFLEHGIHLTVKLFETDELKIEEILSRERQILSKKLTALFPEFNRLWLERNRPGGLDASMDRLKMLNTDYLKM